MSEQKETEIEEDLDTAESTDVIEEDASTAQADQAESTDTEVDEADLAAQLENAQHEIAKLKDAYLRAKAEEDNVRRRAEKEVANSRKFAVEGFAKEMMNVFDSLKLAAAVDIAGDSDEAIKSIHEGVEITLKQLGSGFAKYALKEISPEVGDKLDPNLHQAMSMVESDDVASGSIISVIQVGFELHDRLLRPAMVVVAK